MVSRKHLFDSPKQKRPTVSGKYSASNKNVNDPIFSKVRPSQQAMEATYMQISSDIRDLFL